MTEFHDLMSDEPLKDGVILRRYPDGIETNVPHLVVEHSPTGFEWGYEGSGPADLALNILEAILTEMHYNGRQTDCFKGKCFALASALHQDFKREFIAKIPDEGSVIYYPAIVAWINDHASASEYNQAKERVINTPELQEFEAVLLYDWGDPGFYKWVATAPVDELISWAKDTGLPE